MGDWPIPACSCQTAGHPICGLYGRGFSTAFGSTGVGRCESNEFLLLCLEQHLFVLVSLIKEKQEHLFGVNICMLNFVWPIGACKALHRGAHDADRRKSEARDLKFVMV